MNSFLTMPGLAGVTGVEHGFGMRGSVLPEGLAGLRQIHSDIVLIASKEGVCGDGDALITCQPGVGVSIRTADCYPVLLTDGKAVAAVHAGWRGTAARIVEKALSKMHAEFGTHPEEVHAAIGPGIGVCCYEVGGEVAGRFGVRLDAGERVQIDLERENREQLKRAGVPSENIEASGICTFCDAGRFFSFRREKESAGRMTSFIRLVRPR